MQANLYHGEQPAGLSPNSYGARQPGMKYVAPSAPTAIGGGGMIGSIHAQPYRPPTAPTYNTNYDSTTIANSNYANSSYANATYANGFQRQQTPTSAQHLMNSGEQPKVMTNPRIEPCETFEEMPLHRTLKRNVIDICQYDKPTPVQKCGITAVLNGWDLMACAQTGSGKTAAYLLPTINLALENRYAQMQQQITYAYATSPYAMGRPCCFPFALVLAPTRELSLQIFEETKKFSASTGVRSFVVYGGTDIHAQMRHLSNNIDRVNILVATPGRLLDLHTNSRIVSFMNIRILILDEADRMLDMGFEPQIRAIVEQSDMTANADAQNNDGGAQAADGNAPITRQTLMYSATFPLEIRNLARDFLRRFFCSLQVGRIGSTTRDIEQILEYVPQDQKDYRLYQILTERPGIRVLVFVERKREVDLLEHAMRRTQTAKGRLDQGQTTADRETSCGTSSRNIRQIEPTCCTRPPRRTTSSGAWT